MCKFTIKMNVPRRGMARYGMRSNEISIFGLEFESEDDLRLEGGVDPPFQTSSLERHLQASVSMPIFRGLHGNSASQSESKSGFTDPFQMPRKVIHYLGEESPEYWRASRLIPMNKSPVAL